MEYTIRLFEPAEATDAALTEWFASLAKQKPKARLVHMAYRPDGALLCVFEMQSINQVTVNGNPYGAFLQFTGNTGNLTDEQIKAMRDVDHYEGPMPK